MRPVDSWVFARLDYKINGLFILFTARGGNTRWIFITGFMLRTMRPFLSGNGSIPAGCVLGGLGCKQTTRLVWEQIKLL